MYIKIEEKIKEAARIYFNKDVDRIKIDKHMKISLKNKVDVFEELEDINIESIKDNNLEVPASYEISRKIIRLFLFRNIIDDEIKEILAISKIDYYMEKLEKLGEINE
jgi:hypothetical protein